MKIPWFNKKQIALPHEAVLADDAATWELNTQSPTWKYIDRWSRERLQELRRENDSPRNDEVRTAIIRGKIQQLKELRDLAKPGREDRPEKTAPPDTWPAMR